MILSTIQSVVESLPSPVAFIYANLFEANGDLDIPSQSEGKSIVFVYIPPLESNDETELTPEIHTTFQLQFMLLKRRQDTTVAYKSIDVQPDIDEMRELARKFIAILNEQPVVENGNSVNGKQRDGIDTWKIESIYGEFDQHLFGVAVTCEVPINEGKTLCS